MLKLLTALLITALSAFQVGAENLRLIAANIPVFSYPENGQPKGFAVDLARSIVHRAGGDPNIEIMPLSRAISTTENNNNVILIAIARIPERESKLKWVVKIRDERMMLFTRSDSSVDISTLTNAKALRVGCVRESAAEKLAARAGFSNMDRAANELTNIQKLLAQRFDVWVTGEDFKNFALDQAGISRSLIRSGALLANLEIYIAASPYLSDEVVEKWREQFKLLVRDGGYENIRARYKLSD